MLMAASTLSLPRSALEVAAQLFDLPPSDVHTEFGRFFVHWTIDAGLDGTMHALGRNFLELLWWVVRTGMLAVVRSMHACACCACMRARARAVHLTWGCMTWCMHLDTIYANCCGGSCVCA